MGTKGKDRRHKTRFHSGARREHFTGPTRGKRVARGDKEERKQRKARRKMLGKEREKSANRVIEQGVRGGVKRSALRDLPSLPPVE